ncbi:MAG: OmpH family outer membrane protein [Syntrophorhabdaceae bacterium]|nr:OmpH family outer membrane protein [Syntrophorhabdaceae bacterium]
MKKNILFMGIILALLAIPSILPAQSLNIAYVDLQRVMLESERGKEAKQTLTTEAEKLKKTLDSKQEELQKMKDAIDRQSATITPDARAEKEKQYQSKLKDYQRLYSDYQAELQQKDTELTQKILKDLEEVIKSIGEKEKYTFIFERSQAGILFASPSVDITNKVITTYNESIKKKPVKK